MRTSTTAVAVSLLLALILVSPSAAQYRRPDTQRVVGGDSGSAWTAIADAERAEDSIEALRADGEFARLLRASPDLQKKLQQAQAKLALAHDSYAQGTSIKYSEAAQFAIAAKHAFNALETDLRAAWERARAGELHPGQPDEQELALRRSLRNELEPMLTDGRELLARPGPFTQVTTERRGELGKAIRDYERLGAAASSTELRRVREALWNASSDLKAAYRLPDYTPADLAVPLPGRRAEAPSAGAGRPSGRPPQPLREAVTAFFAGNYRDAVVLLADTEYGDEHARKVALLVRGAALFSLYVESGEKEPSLLERALADVRACQRLDPTLEPDRSAFSPRYAELFRR